MTGALALPAAVSPLARRSARERRVRLGVVVGVAALAGWLTALTMPRGPITPTAVDVAMLVGASFGALAGFVLRSRWAMLVAPVAFTAAVELGRLEVVGPTVDRPQASKFFGVHDLAARTGDTALAERVQGYGPPPYRDIYAYAFLIDYYDAIGPYPRTDYYLIQIPAGIDGTGEPGYGPLDKVNKLTAMIDKCSVMYRS